MDDSKVDETKGRVKEATGTITGDDELKREGKTDQAAASVKDKLESAKDKAGDAVDGVKKKLTGKD